MVSASALSYASPTLHAEDERHKDKPAPGCTIGEICHPKLVWPLRGAVGDLAYSVRAVMIRHCSRSSSRWNRSRPTTASSHRFWSPTNPEQFIDLANKLLNSFKYGLNIGGPIFFLEYDMLFQHLALLNIPYHGHSR